VSGTARLSSSSARSLEPTPAAVSQARTMVRELLDAAGRTDLAENATLLVSELVTNALLHAGTQMHLRLSVDDQGLRVEVGDGSRHVPVRRRYGATAGTGRGMMMLEQLVDDWGVSRRRHGKTVWFRLSSAEHADAEPVIMRPTGATDSGAAKGAVQVDLLNMPLLLHAAWQEHAEALLRDYLLANLDEAELDAIRVHAEATDAIAILEEHVPGTVVAVDPEQLMQDATEPRVSASVLRVPVPAESVPHFATLDRAIEDALGLSIQGVVLTPPTQPEVRAFRQWVCRQVLGQSEGAEPSPWSMGHEPRAPRGVALDREHPEVSGAPAGRIAADESSRILAASPAVLHLLGYDDAADLVGHRIVTIIPERYRQAHVAGFTLFQLVGRRPLIGTPVVVPALRKDGSEVTVELTVNVAPAGDGQSVFVADLRPVDQPG
jgi:PAS domain S-box-containing protein